MIKFPTNARIYKEVIIVTEVKIVEELKTVKEVKIGKEVKLVKTIWPVTSYSPLIKLFHMYLGHTLASTTHLLGRRGGRKAALTGEPMKCGNLENWWNIDGWWEILSIRNFCESEEEEKYLLRILLVTICSVEPFPNPYSQI